MDACSLLDHLRCFLTFAETRMTKRELVEGPSEIWAKCTSGWPAARYSADADSLVRASQNTLLLKRGQVTSRRD